MQGLTRTESYQVKDRAVLKSGITHTEWEIASESNKYVEGMYEETFLETAFSPSPEAF